MTVNKAVITISGVKREYRFWHISDVHIAYASPDDSDETQAIIKKRANKWKIDGRLSSEVFSDILDEAKKSNTDQLIITGDCLDYCSESNLKYITDNLKNHGIPTTYVYGNHEGICLLKTPGDPRRFYPSYSELMGETPDFQVQDFGDFLMIAVDNSDHYIREEQLDKLKEQFAKGVPVILLMHIPLTTEAILPPLLEKWSKNPAYFMLGTDTEPETTREFCRLITAENSPVVAIFAGHVHFMHEGEFMPGRMQYTAAPGCCWNITVKGDN